MWFAFYPPYPFSRSKRLFKNMSIIIGKTKEKKTYFYEKIREWFEENMVNKWTTFW